MGAAGAVRAGGFKFIEAPRPELYDLGQDPANSKTYTSLGIQQSNTSARIWPRRRCGLPQVSASQAPRGTLHSTTFVLWATSDQPISKPRPTFPNFVTSRSQRQNRGADLLHSAMLLIDQGRSPDAQLLLQKVLQLDPDSRPHCAN